MALGKVRRTGIQCSKKEMEYKDFLFHYSNTLPTVLPTDAGLTRVELFHIFTWMLLSDHFAPQILNSCSKYVVKN